MRNISSKFIILHSQREHAPFENTAVSDTDLRTLPNIQIFQQKLDGNKGSITILCGGLGQPNPKAYMDNIVSNYVVDEMYNEFIEIFLDNPYVRVIISGINEIEFEEYKGQTLSEFINMPYEKRSPKNK